jgi:hypothetical protein
MKLVAIIRKCFAAVNIKISVAVKDIQLDNMRLCFYNCLETRKAAAKSTAFGGKSGGGFVYGSSQSYA